MHLEYKGIVIRNAEHEDCGQLAKWWNDGSVMAHAGFPNGLGTSEDEVAEGIAKESDDTKRRLIIVYRGKSIGEMSFHIYDGTKYEIGIKICEAEYREKGLGRVILSMLIEELFARGASLVFLDTDLGNTRAQHVYEMLGFRKVRVNIDSWRDQTGNTRSSVDYEMTKEEFINMK